MVPNKVPSLLLLLLHLINIWSLFSPRIMTISKPTYIKISLGFKEPSLVQKNNVVEVIFQEPIQIHPSNTHLNKFYRPSLKEFCSIESTASISRLCFMCTLINAAGKQWRNACMLNKQCRCCTLHPANGPHGLTGLDLWAHTVVDG